MREKILHTSVNLLVEPALYQRLKMSARIKKIPMSKIIREGINMRLDQMERENQNAMIIGGNHNAGRSDQ